MTDHEAITDNPIIAAGLRDYQRLKDLHRTQWAIYREAQDELHRLGERAGEARDALIQVLINDVIGYEVPLGKWTRTDTEATS